MAELPQNVKKDDPPNRVVVTCAQCGIRLRARAQEKDRTVPCSKCQSPIRIPAAAGKTPRKQFSRVTVCCPECRANFEARVTPDDLQVSCLVCDADVPVPGSSELLQQSQAKDKKKKKAEQAANVFVETKAARKKRSRRTRPRWWSMFLGVLTFSWQPSVIVRWGLLSGGCVAVSLTGVLTWWSASIGGVFYRAAYGFGLAFAWLALGTLSYAAACGMNVLIETAAGANEIHGWPEPIWKDWVVEFYRMSVHVLQAGAVAFGIGQIFFMGTGYFWPPLLAVMFFLFPILWLSSLESGLLLIPFSRPVLVSLLRAWWRWLLFYSCAAIMAAIWPGLLAITFVRISSWKDPSIVFVIAPVTGPLMAAVLLTYPRLLGLLGLQITAAAE